VALLAAASGFVEGREIALVFGLLLAGGQAVTVLAFQERCAAENLRRSAE